MPKISRHLLIAAVCFVNICLGVAYLRTARFVDVPQFYLAAKLFRAGRIAHIYDVQAYEPLIVELAKSDPEAAKGAVHFNRPAFELLLFLPFAFVPFKAFLFANIALNGILLAVLIWKLPQWFPVSIHCRTWLLIFFPFLSSVALGQDTLLLAYGFHLALEEHDSRAGIFMALAAFKPHLIFLLPLAFVAARRWKLLRSFVTVGTVLALMSFVLVGPQGMRDWIEILRSPYTDYAPATMGNLRAIGVHLGMPAVVIAGLIALGCFVFILRRGSFHAAFAAALITALLLSPHTYVQDYSTLAIAAMLSFPPAAVFAVLLPWPYFIPSFGHETLVFMTMGLAALVWMATMHGEKSLKATFPD